LGGTLFLVMLFASIIIGKKAQNFILLISFCLIGLLVYYILKNLNANTFI
jgi:hypothetical protein